jgi:excisionase family DNA binding protein
MPDHGERRPITRADVMRAAEVSELLSVPKSTIQDWARRGVIPSCKRGKCRFFLRWQIEEWLTRDDLAA